MTNICNKNTQVYTQAELNRMNLDNNIITQISALPWNFDTTVPWKSTNFTG